MKAAIIKAHSVLLLMWLLMSCHSETESQQQLLASSVRKDSTLPRTQKAVSPHLDTPRYTSLLLYLAHDSPTVKWPVKTPYPLPGAILPFKRVVTFYGNFYSAGMGILGEIPPDKMLQKLEAEVKKWELADTVIPVLPALEYIAVTAQRRPGKDGKYRLRMPADQINKAVKLSAEVKGILFLDIQVGHSSVRDEVPVLLPFLQMADVHLAIDPEYSMKTGAVPCSEIGSFDAEDINFASGFLAEIVRKHRLPPKILVIHRFTKAMVTNYKKIITRPEVQIVMNMDGFGFPAKKIDTYRSWIAGEPVQFTGFKLFYKQDIVSPPHLLMTPKQILNLYPSPIYIHYQ